MHEKVSKEKNSFSYVAIATNSCKGPMHISPHRYSIFTLNRRIKTILICDLKWFLCKNIKPQKSNNLMAYEKGYMICNPFNTFIMHPMFIL